MAINEKKEKRADKEDNMNPEVLLANSDQTVGFIHVPAFEGIQTIVELKYLKQAIRHLEQFEEMGLTPTKLAIDIEKSEKDQGLIIFFLDEKQKTGLAIAPLCYPKEDK